MAKGEGTMPTLGKVDDELWRWIKPIIEVDMPGHGSGRRAAGCGDRRCKRA